MRKFYRSMATDGIRWIPRVRDVEIPMTPETLSRVWAIPIHGLAANWVGDKDAAFKYILEHEDIRGVSVVSANQLSLEMRVLHHIIARILVPKTGRFDFITE